MAELMYHQVTSYLLQGVSMRVALGLFLCAAMTPMAMATEIDIAGGVEYFQWEEFSDTGGKYLDETGPRYFVQVVGTNRLDREWSIDFGGRFYSGTVDYDGGTTSGVPLTTDTDYNGFRTELGFTRQVAAGGSPGGGNWHIRFALGLEQWRRSLQDTALSNGTPVSGYVERYASRYAKVGASYHREGRWSLGIGAKAPFYTSEEISDYPGVAGTLTLEPEGQLSLYADVDMAISEAWRVALGYDSYRFAQSDKVRVGSNLFWQPESTQDTLSIALHYRF